MGWIHLLLLRFYDLGESLSCSHFYYLVIIFYHHEDIALPLMRGGSADYRFNGTSYHGNVPGNTWAMDCPNHSRGSTHTFTRGGGGLGWSIQGGLHTEYSSNFMQRNRGKIHCVFGSNLLPNLIKDLDAFHLSEPASPPQPRGRLDHEHLIEQFKEMRVEGRKTLFSTLVDCAKGFLTVEDRDQMANLIRPDPAPLPLSHQPPHL